jgi:hypothetical protein
MRLASVVLTLAVAVMLIADRVSAETQRDRGLQPGATCFQNVCVGNEGKTPEEQEQAIKRRPETQPHQGLKATVASQKAAGDRTGDDCTVYLDSGLIRNGKCVDSKCSICRAGSQCGAGDQGKETKCSAELKATPGRVPAQAAPGVKVTK